MRAISWLRRLDPAFATDSVRRFARRAQSRAYAILRGSSAAPVGVLLGQAANQCAKFRRDPRPTATRQGFPAPVQTEAGPMPTYHGFGFDDHQRIPPARPRLSQDRPE